MKEDAVIEGWAKRALEDGADVRAETLQAIMIQATRGAVRRRRRRVVLWGVSALTAASLTFVLFFEGVFFPHPAADGFADIRNALDLLCAVDDISANLTALPPEEMLLAWQDAPFAQQL